MASRWVFWGNRRESPRKPHGSEESPLADDGNRVTQSSDCKPSVVTEKNTQRADVVSVCSWNRCRQWKRREENLFYCFSSICFSFQRKAKLGSPSLISIRGKTINIWFCSALWRRMCATVAFIERRGLPWPQIKIEEIWCLFEEASILYVCIDLLSANICTIVSGTSKKFKIAESCQGEFHMQSIALRTATKPTPFIHFDRFFLCKNSTRYIWLDFYALMQIADTALYESLSFSCFFGLFLLN